MAPRTLKQVDSAAVREWAHENNWKDELDRPVADRGRMPSGLIDAFNKAEKKNGRQYTPQPRPVRADSRGGDQGSTSRSTRSSGGNSGSGRSASTTAAPKAEKASAPASASVEAPAVADNSNGVQSIQDVIAMLTAASNGKKGGRPAVVTIQTLVNV